MNKNKIIFCFPAHMGHSNIHTKCRKGHLEALFTMSLIFPVFLMFHLFPESMLQQRTSFLASDIASPLPFSFSLVFVYRKGEGTYPST